MIRWTRRLSLSWWVLLMQSRTVARIPGLLFVDGGGEGDERFEAAALGFGAVPVQQDRDVGFVQVGVEHRT